MNRPYNNQRWRKKRASQLAKEPLCEFCLERGEVVPATVADHVEPHRGDMRKFWNGELQSLCAACHNSDKQRIENGGKPKPTFGEDGWPV